MPNDKPYKSSGVQLPIFSLPDQYGIGTIGKGARKFIDFLHDSGFRYWLILPLVPTAYLDSPYSSFSSRALNPYFIDLEDLVEKGLLLKRDLAKIDWGEDKTQVDYGKIYENRSKVLHIAYRRFLKGQGDYQRGYVSFLRNNPFLDYACFMALKESNGNKPWSDFKEPYNQYSLSQFREVKHRNKYEVEFQMWTQYIFLKQWDSLKDYAHSKDVQIIGEMPMYVSYDSIDVYRHRLNFKLNRQFKMDYESGYPSNFATKEGQRWGVPVFDFDYLEKRKFNFISLRLGFSQSLFDIVMVSSMQVLFEYYSIKTAEKNISKGTWHKGPGDKVFDHVHFDPERTLAETVEVYSPEMKESLRKRGLPSMTILEYAFPREETNINNPKVYDYNTFSFSSYHDCMPLVGYYDEMDPESKEKAKKQINECCYSFGIDKTDGTSKDNARAIMELNLASPSKVAIQTMNDILLQGKETRINTPNKPSGNWRYRITEKDLSKDLAEKLYQLNKKYGRI